MRRVAAATVAVVLAVILPAGPASAHTVGGVEATNYRSELTSVSPHVPGITLRVRDLGRRLEVTNRTNQDLVVLGYQNEPYLRVGPAGVFENRRSPSLFQNKLASGNTSLVTLPPEADPTAPPEWRRRGGGTSVSWRDHRARWDGDDPPSVRANPGATQIVVPRWVVGMLHGQASQQPIVVTGRITWVPGPAVWPWLLLAAVLLGAAFLAGMSMSWPTVLSGMLAVLLAVDMVRLFGAATLGGGSLAGELFKALALGVLEVAAWVGGVWALGAIQRAHPAGLYAAMAVGIVIAFVSGVGDILNLAYSQVPNGLPVTVTRGAVAVCLGVGFGIVGGCFLALRRLPAPAPVAA